MDQEPAFTIKIILNHAIELEDRQEEFFGNSNLFATFHSEWIDILSWISDFWRVATPEQKTLINVEYNKVKPIALKLKLPWPAELS